jgi:hypothetical protein
MRLLPIYRGEFVMKIIIAALAVTAMLASSAVAKTQRTKEVHIQPNNSELYNSVANSSFCRFHYAQTDPDPRIRSQLLRDCRDYELSGSE